MGGGGQAPRRCYTALVMPLLIALAAALLVVITALLLHRLAWREQLSTHSADQQLRGRICGPGGAATIVAEGDVHGCAQAASAIGVRAQGQELQVEVHGAQLELRWRPKRGMDLRVGDRVAIWLLQRPGETTQAATRVLRAGWPGLLTLCVVASVAIGAAIVSYRLAQPTGCPADTRPRLQRQRTLVERACVREDGTRHGPALEMTHGGRLLARGFYREGKKEGRWQRYFRNGKLAEQISYRADKQHGPLRRYLPDGRLLGRAEMTEGAGLYEALHSNGKTAERGRIVAGERDGPWQYFRNDGERASEGIFTRGKKHGRWRSWHQGGKLAWESSFSRGKRHGPWRSFFEDGKPEKEGAFLGGKRSGAWRFYHRNGKLARAGTFVDGKQHGAWTLYDEAGQIQIEGHYQRDRRVGPWRWFCARCRDCDVCSAAQREAGEVVKKDYDAAASRPTTLAR